MGAEDRYQLVELTVQSIYLLLLGLDLSDLSQDQFVESGQI